MPQPTNSLYKLVNPEAAKEAGAGPLLIAWARRTQHGLESSDRQVEALATIDSSSPYYQHLGGDEMSAWAKAVMSAAPVFIDVLGLPYGGPNNGKDNDGNWFSPLTDFMDGVIDSPPVLYGHGAITKTDSDVHGKVHARWYDKEGGWFKVELKRDSPRFDKLLEAHQKGTLFASSGAVPATVEIAESGHIDRWLVGELTLVDVRDGYRPSNGYAITKANAVDEALFSNYYGDPVRESNPNLWERIQQLFNALREDVASLIASDGVIEEDKMTKCEKCDQEAATEAEKLREMLTTMKAEQEANKPVECLPCRAAVKWVGEMVKANKMPIDEAMDAVNKFEVDATGWETFKAEVEGRDTTIHVAIAKAQQTGTNFTVVTGNRGDGKDTVDPTYMNRMRDQVGLGGKK